MSIKILLWCLNVYQVNAISRIKVGVVGLGYVGLPLAVFIAKIPNTWI